MRLVEIGEAIKAITPDLLATETSQPWRDIARMRDRLAHHYFDTTHARVTGVVTNDLEPLKAAVHRLQTRVTHDE